MQHVKILKHINTQQKDIFCMWESMRTQASPSAADCIFGLNSDHWIGLVVQWRLVLNVCVRERQCVSRWESVINVCVSMSVCLCVAAGRRWLVPGLVIPSPTHSLMWFEAVAFTMEGNSHRTHSHCSHMSVETHIACCYAVTFSEMQRHILS